MEMNFKAIISSIALTAMLAVPQAGFAGTLRIAPDAPAGSLESLDLACVVDSIGQIKIPRGRLVVRNGRAELSCIPEFQFDRVPVLDGALIKQSLNSTAVDGVIFILEGPWLQHLAQQGQLDSVSTASGTTQGRITNIENGTIELDAIDKKHVSINLSDVTNLQSPRALSFHVNTIGAAATNLASGANAETGRATLTPVRYGDKVSIANLNGLRQELKKQEDGDMSNRKIAAICTGASLLQLAQTAPLITLALQYDRMARTAYYKQLQQLTGYQMPNLGTITSPTGAPTVSPIYPGDLGKFNPQGPFISFPSDALETTFAGR